MWPKTVPSNFRIIAHRGASAYAPENTFAAFDLALELGATDVELDVQRTVDGVLVLCHDDTLARYGHGDRAVESCTRQELIELDMGSWFSPHFYGGERMVTLEGLFARYGDGLHYDVELKGAHPDLPAQVAKTIEAHGLVEQCVLTSFAMEKLQRARDAAPDLRYAWIVGELDEWALEGARELGLYGLDGAAAHMSLERVAAAHEIVSEVRAWGLAGDGPLMSALVDRAVEAGCDGLTINAPDWLRHS